jgi:hypothetical protein
MATKHPHRRWLRTFSADFGPSEPTPRRYGRHATAHSARPEQYTTANAVVAVMLAASVLRQAESSGWGLSPAIQPGITSESPSGHKAAAGLSGAGR